MGSEMCIRDRACSVLRKSNADATFYEDIDYTKITDEYSIALTKELARFKEVIQLAADKYEPSFVAVSYTHLTLPTIYSV